MKRERRQERPEFKVSDKLTVYSEQGKRDYQEDRYIAESCIINGQTLQVLAVMDGHGGSEVAEQIRTDLIPTLRVCASEVDTDIPKLLRATIYEINLMTKNQRSGSTLSMVVIPENENTAYAAVIGDSPIIIQDSEDFASFSPDHNVRTNKAELDAAIKRGAMNTRGYITEPLSGESLQMSRALGDGLMDKILDRRPETYSVNLGKDSFVIIASDGVLDPHHKNTNDEERRVGKMVRDGADAKALVKDALKRKTNDNATAIVWRAV